MRALQGKLIAAVPSKREEDSKDLPISPTKGILLTPGVGASRRKNVSFMHVEEEDPDYASFADYDAQMPVQDSSPTRGRHRRDNRVRLFGGPVQRNKQLLESKCCAASEDGEDAIGHPVSNHMQVRTVDESIQAELDHTMDLSTPRSRSGQHWKAEFDVYYQKSDVEMKRIIQHSQNVKSYAVQKDSEAAKLIDQVKQERARAEALERKVSRLNEQLKAAQAKDPKGSGDRGRLIGELAQQTALVNKYKEIALMRQDPGSSSSTNAEACEEGPKSTMEEEEIGRLQEAAHTAEARASALESENDTLKRSMARVKQEMMGYESRRQAREERLKKREDKHKAAKITAEAELARLQLVNETLMQGQRANDADPARNLISQTSRTSKTGIEEAVTITGNNDPSQFRGTSPRRRTRHRPPIDIWTQSSPDNNGVPLKPSSDASALQPSSVRNDIQKVLKEIDSNLRPVPSEPLPTDLGSGVQKKTLEPIGYEDGVPIWPDTSTAMVANPIPKREPASSPAKLEAHPPRSSPHAVVPSGSATTGRSASMSSRRTGSLASRRTRPPMTAERAAETRARLAKRSAEKRRAHLMR